MFPFWGAARFLVFFLPQAPPPLAFPALSHHPQFYFLRTNSLQLSASFPTCIASTPSRNMKPTRPTFNMDDNPDSATPDEVKKSTKNLRLAVEHAISLPVSPKEVKEVVNLAIEAGMKKHIGLTVKRAISEHVSPEQVRAVVEDAIKENDTKIKRRSTKLTIGHHVPFANLVIVQSSLICWGRTRSDRRQDCFLLGDPRTAK